MRIRCSRRTPSTAVASNTHLARRVGSAAGRGSVRGIGLLLSIDMKISLEKLRWMLLPLAPQVDTVDPRIPVIRNGKEMLESKGI